MKTVPSSRLKNLSALDLYLTLIITVGVTVLIVALPRLSNSSSLLTGLIIFSFLAVVAEMHPVHLPEHCVICVSSSFHIASLFLFGTEAAILVAAVGSGIADLFERRALRKTLFNISQYAICTGLAGVVFNLTRSFSGSLNLLRDFGPLVLSVITYFCLNALFISVVIALSEGFSVTDILLINIKDVAFQYFASAAIGVLIAVIYHQQSTGIILLMLPLLIIYFALRNYMELQTQTRKVLEMLADLIDKRDPYTYQHSQKVAEFAVLIARRLGLSKAEVDVIQSAARIHDLGKIIIDNKILLKPEKLSAEEYSLIKEHPRVGAEIVRLLQSYQKGADYVLYHHEFYDGSGYPTGISGSQIPLGGRIIAAADAFHAMTSDRPYRQARSREEAMEVLRKYAGTQFDPQVIDAFLSVLWEEK